MSRTKIAGSFVVLAIIAIAIWKLGVFPNRTSSDYQAVFLTNDQVYFGKIVSESRADVRLTDVFYLQVQQPVQPIGEGQSAGQNVSLVKLGDELHGPEDEMRINRDHILFIENLKNDSQVVRKIVEFKASQGE